ncbi:MAG: hypothetical protein WCL07_02735 [bacterium]
MNNEQMMIVLWLRKHTVIVRGIVIILISLVVLFTGTIPLLQRAQKAQKDLGLLNTKSEELTNQVYFLSNLDQEVLKQRVKVLDATLPPNKDILLYLRTIDGLSRDLNLSLKGVQLSPGELSTASATKAVTSENLTGLHSLETKLVIAGSYENIFNFLKTIEQTAPLMRVKDVKVSKSGENNFNLSLILGMIYADVAETDALKGQQVLFDENEETLVSQLGQLKSYNIEDVSGSTASAVAVGKSNLFEALPQAAND